MPETFFGTSYDGRTYLALQHHAANIVKGSEKRIILNDELIPIVTRDTRNFNTPLCSIGSSDLREILVLNPKDEALKSVYTALKKYLSDTFTPIEILFRVKKVVQICFAHGDPDSFIKNQLKQGRSVISLSEFIIKRQGVCRHHALLNAYLLSRLVEDKLLKGHVIQHRQDFKNRGAHTWNLFYDDKGNGYSLDSLWNNIVCIHDNPGALNRIYKEDVESEIKRMHQFTEKRKTLKEKIAQFKSVSKNERFPADHYRLFKSELISAKEDFEFTTKETRPNQK